MRLSRLSSSPVSSAPRCFPRHRRGTLYLCVLGPVGFLFPAERAQSPVKSLSGGERNRLLLARLFTRPANVLILDEPTNDLDLETLELLEAELVTWPGTLLLVSHDRAFLDNVVTSTLVFEGDGHVQEYVGGYQDWIRQRTATAAVVAAGVGAVVATNVAKPAAEPATSVTRAGSGAGGRSAGAAKKLSYKERREFEALPELIGALEAEQRAINAAIAEPTFYRAAPGTIASTLERATAIGHELAAHYARWDALDSRSKL